MPILNYTTQIEVEKTISEIQKCLSSHGATAILSEYDQKGYITALSFKMRIGDEDFGFKLPTNWEPVLKIMENSPKVPRRLCNQPQALRVAWRIIKDWTEAQMAIVETKMVKTEQVFLPYMQTSNGETLFDKFEGNRQLLLN